MGAYSPDEQARNLMEVAAAARAAGLDALLTGDSHAADPAYAATFSPLPTVARLMSVTGDMPIGAVPLAPFYHPLLLAEQIGTLAAFAEGPLIVTFVLGGRPQQFQAFGMDERNRVGRLSGISRAHAVEAGSGHLPAVDLFSVARLREHRTHRNPSPR